MNIIDMVDEIMFSNEIAVDFNWWGGSLHLEEDVDNITVGDGWLRIDGACELTLELMGTQIEREEYGGCAIYVIKHAGVTGIVQNRTVAITILN